MNLVKNPLEIPEIEVIGIIVKHVSTVKLLVASSELMCSVEKCAPKRIYSDTTCQDALSKSGLITLAGYGENLRKIKLLDNLKMWKS